MKWLLDRPIAHRGLHDSANNVVENSLAAFEAACRAGYPIELDVRLLSDQTVVVFHDADLDRLTNVAGPLQPYTATSLRKIKLNSDGMIPTLAETLDLVDGRVGVLVEIKSDLGAAPGAIETAVAAKLECYTGDVAVQSFNPATIEWFKENAPRFPRGQLAGPRSDASHSEEPKQECLGMLELPDPHFIGYDSRDLPNPRVSELREAGMPVLAWTVRSFEQERDARQYSDNVIFEGYRPS